MFAETRRPQDRPTAEKLGIKLLQLGQKRTSISLQACLLRAKSGHHSRALAYSLNGYDVVSRQRAANALEGKIADRFDCYVLLDCHQDARTN
jgi:hypothetical protein